MTSIKLRKERYLTPRQERKFRLKDRRIVAQVRARVNTK